jgi:FMN phosphatase YigB (HAD superfamily)
MIKSFLFDIDGVLLRHDNWFFNDFCKDKTSSALSTICEYCFGEDIIACDRGIADSHKMILPYLRKIGYQNSVEDFFKVNHHHQRWWLELGL